MTLDHITAGRLTLSLVRPNASVGASVVLFLFLA
jgi:hypothetical protein